MHHTSWLQSTGSIPPNPYVPLFFSVLGSPLVHTTSSSRIRLFSALVAKPTAHRFIADPIAIKRVRYSSVLRNMCANVNLSVNAFTMFFLKKLSIWYN